MVNGLYLYNTYLVLMTTQSTLQFSFSLHTLRHTFSAFSASMWNISWDGEDMDAYDPLVNDPLYLLSHHYIRGQHNCTWNNILSPIVPQGQSDIHTVGTRHCCLFIPAHTKLCRCMIYFSFRFSTLSRDGKRGLQQ